MTPTLEVFSLTFSLVTEHRPKDGQDRIIERGAHQQINVAAKDGAEAQEYVRAVKGTPNSEVVFHGGPSLVVSNVHAVPASWHDTSCVPSADDLDAVEAEKQAAAATAGGEGNSEGEDASLD